MAMTPAEKLAEAREHLSDIRTQIQSYSYGDRPQSPPVGLLRDEQRALVVVAWWEKEVARLDSAPPSACVEPAVIVPVGDLNAACVFAFYAGMYEATLGAVAAALSPPAAPRLAV